MKIITLGTGHGAAEPDRNCTATLLEVNDRYYLIDCGCSVDHLMIKGGYGRDKGTVSLDAVFITHMHEDHTGGLSAVVKRFSGYQGHKCLNIYMPEQKGIDGFKAWMYALHSTLPESRTSYHLVNEGKIYDDGNITVSAVHTQHIAGFDTFAYIVEGEGKKILFTGDLTADIHDYPVCAYEEEFDGIVCELTHYNLHNAMPILTKSKTKKLIFTHIYPTQVNDFETEKDNFPFEALLAEDGSCFEI